jgi:hypothetical protein
VHASDHQSALRSRQLARDLRSGAPALSRRWRRALVRRSRNDWLLAGTVVVAGILYFPLNRKPAHPHVLAGALDRDLPVVPVLAVPYVVFLPVFWLTLAHSFVTDRRFASFAWRLVAVFLISDAVYFVYPTYMPRPAHVQGLFSGVVRFVYAHDHPYNDFPSGHTAQAVLLALYLWPRGRTPRAVGAAFAVTVIPATMLIKQHSIIGAAGGVCLAVGAWYAPAMARRLLTRSQAGIEN